VTAYFIHPRAFGETRNYESCSPRCSRRTDLDRICRRIGKSRFGVGLDGQSRVSSGQFEVKFYPNSRREGTKSSRRPIKPLARLLLGFFLRYFFSDVLNDSCRSRCANSAAASRISLVVQRAGKMSRQSAVFLEINKPPSVFDCVFDCRFRNSALLRLKIRCRSLFEGVQPGWHQRLVAVCLEPT
jgi:hypothetical protein